MNKKKNNKGFSLIELIIAIAILIILTGLLAPQFMKYIEKSREAKDMQTLDTVYTAVQGAFADEGAYEDFIKESENGAYKAIDEGMELTDILKESDKFAVELQTLLGSKDGKTIKLVSKKASGGVVGVIVKYVEAKTDSTGNEIAAGLEIGVYCAKSGDATKGCGTLSHVGANTPAVPSETEK